MKFLLPIICLCLPLLVGAQSVHKERIEKKLTFETPTGERQLMIRNISGSIEVSAYDGKDIQLEVTKTISADKQSDIDQGKKDIQLGVAQKGNRILLYMATPCTQVNPSILEGKDDVGWNMWKDDCNLDTDYEFKMDYQLKVPRQINLSVYTVNEGDIIIRNTEGALEANNVNGAITLESIKGATEARTVNGDVNINYVANPDANCSYYTLNGDINARFLPGLSAEVYFKSFNGDFFTSLEDINPFTPKLKKESGSSTKYKINGNMGFTTGGGGTKLEFETFNGNVYLKTE